jgi:hypothetical protein
MMKNENTDSTQAEAEKPTEQPIGQFDIDKREPKKHEYIQRGNMLYCDGTLCGNRHSSPISSPLRTLTDDGKGGVHFVDD